MLAAIVCGGRDPSLETVVLVRKVISRLKDGTLLITGGAQGVDSLADSYYNGPKEVFVADWKSHGPKAGPMRNLQMANRLIQLRDQGYSVGVIAFKGGRGTKSMIEIAKARDLKVIEF